MILCLKDLEKHEFALSGINVIKQKPVYSKLDVNGRGCNGFIHILSGECKYSFYGADFTLTKGETAYLPKGSHHCLELLQRTEFYRVDFTVTIDGEIALFSDCPTKLAASSEDVGFLFAHLEKECEPDGSTVRKNELLCRALRILTEAKEDTVASKILPAVRYLREHFTDRVDCSELAGLCFLGTSQFYKLFTGAMNKTPLEYRNSLIIARAKQLLSLGESTVSEIAFSLGFDSVAYFSRMFKKEVGHSPTDYIRDVSSML